MSKKKVFKKSIIIILFVIFVIFIYAYFKVGKEILTSDDQNVVTIRDDFDSLNSELWYVGEWLTHNKSYDKIFIKDGIVSLPVTERDKAPYLLSKPIEIGDHDLIIIKRRIKIHYDSDYFVGGLAIFQTEKDNFTPIAKDKLPFGSALFLMEYAHDLGINTKRPGIDNFRLLAPDWEQNDNYALISPIFDKWFTEQIVIDKEAAKVKYILNGNVYQIENINLGYPYIRLWCHGYGAFTGHKTEIDYIEITLTYGENEAMIGES